jgi:F-type H+-transporting ATPase subunit delta
VNREELPLEYARTIYQMALEEWSAWLEAVRQRLTGDPGLARLLASPDVSPAEKQQRVAALLPPQASPQFRQFMRYLTDKGHLGLLSDIISSYMHVVQRGPEVTVAYVTSAVELTPAERQALQDKLRQRFGAGLEFEYSVDPALYGGVRVRVGDTVIDGSIAAQLEALRSKLLSR